MSNYAPIGLASVTETVTDLDDLFATLAQITVSAPPPLTNLSAQANLTENEDGIHVDKDILLLTNNSTGAVTASFIDQNFSRVPVPEPASIALLGSALVGFGLYRRRRNRA